MKHLRPVLATGHLLAFAVFAGVTLLWFFNLLPHLADGYAHDAGDPALNAWILSWNAKALPYTSAWWDAPVFFPLRGVTAFTEVLLGVSVLASPLLWVTQNPVLTYNLVFLLSFPLSAFCAYLLALELTGDRRAAFVAGIVYGFAPYRIAQVTHLQVLWSFWMPLALFGLHRYLRLRQWRWLAVFGAAWLLQALSNGYYLLFFTIFLGLWAAWFMSRRDEWRAVPPVVAAGLVAALPVVPVLLKYRQVQGAFGLTRTLKEIIFYSGDVTSFLTPSPLLRLWGWAWSEHFAKPEGELFPGLVVLLVVAIGVIVTVWRAPRERQWTRLRIALAAAGVAALVVSGVVLVFGAWRVTISSVRILSVSRVYKPFTLFLVSVCALAVTHPRFVQAFRRRSSFAFYLAGGLLAALSSLGPEPTMLARRFFYRPPYALLLQLPGFSGLRVPTRFWMIGILCLSVAAACAFTRFAPRRPRWSTAVMALIALGLTLDAWPVRMPIAPAPAPVACSSDDPLGPDPDGRPRVLLQLPLGDLYRDIAAMQRSLVRGRVAINGYSGYLPPHYFALQMALAGFNRDVFAELTTFGQLEVVIDTRADDYGRNARFVARQPGAVERTGCTNRLRVFEIPAAARRATLLPAAGRPAPVTGLQTDFAAEFLRGVTDDDLTTRWEAPQQNDRWIVVDVGTPRRLAALTLQLGPFYFDYPRVLRIEASTDAVNWTPLSEGPTVVEAVKAMMRDPKRAPMEFPLDGVVARYLRLTQIGRDPIYSWSIAGMSVTEAPRGAPGQ